jgi:hypothetical protein
VGLGLALGLSLVALLGVVSIADLAFLLGEGLTSTLESGEYGGDCGSEYERGGAGAGGVEAEAARSSVVVKGA